MCKHGDTTELVIGGKHVQVDSCISDLVWALNQGGLATIRSCCGHGRWPGWIHLDDGRTLLIHDTGVTGEAERPYPCSVHLEIAELLGYPGAAEEDGQEETRTLRDLLESDSSYRTDYGEGRVSYEIYSDDPLLEYGVAQELSTLISPEVVEAFATAFARSVRQKLGLEESEEEGPPDE